jgi:hypothetical protein
MESLYTEMEPSRKGGGVTFILASPIQEGWQ